MIKRTINLEYIEGNLQMAVETMRRACESAERELKRTDETPEYRIGQVQHAFVWGLANASTGITTALAECSCDRKRREE